MSLPTRPLGTTGMEITTVGLGAWAIGGGDWAWGWSRQADASSIAAIRRALELGISWIDTAAVYGLGHSEEVVAEALRDLPKSQRPFVFTKCGQVWDEANPFAQPRRVGNPASLRRELEASLRRLRVDYIDLYQMHFPAADGNSVEEVWQCLLDFKAEGKIRAAGLSNHNVPQLAAAETLGHVDSLQPPFSAIRRDAAAAEIPWCRDHGTGVIVYSPLQSGLLSGGFSLQRMGSLAKDDWRHRSGDFQGEALQRNLALAEVFTALGQERGVSTASMAIAWTLAFPGVSGAIVGARSALQVEGWIAGASLTLTAAEMNAIAAAITKTHAGSGPCTLPG
jgi:aryl-alcohol dehydrogenase-like predicted oxidoreductase